MAVVDANVVRVLARLRRLAGDPKSSAMSKLNARLADTLVDPDRPGCFNQVSNLIVATQKPLLVMLRVYSALLLRYPLELLSRLR